MRTLPLWSETAKAPSWPCLESNVSVDVAIIGAGITGLTAAALLAREGLRVAVLESRTVAGGETGHTTAHLTEAVDAGYHVLEHRFGHDGATRVATSIRSAISQIEALLGDFHIDCGFRRVPGFLYTEKESGVGAVEQEVEAARRSGLMATFTREVPLPFEVKGAMRLERQAQLDPLRYLLPLAQALSDQGVQIFESTRVIEVHDGAPCRLTTEAGFEVTARQVFVASNVPVNNRFFLQTKVASYRSYAVAGPAAHAVPPGLYWDTEDPYHYTRTEQTPMGEVLIVGGEDHKTGQEEDTEGCFLRLESYARERFGLAPTFRWSGQIVEPSDGLPYIGLNSGSKHVFVATGYSGTGLTFGTLAAQVVSDLVLGRNNPYASLYDATRVKPLASFGTYLSENVDYPAHLIVDRARRPPPAEFAAVAPGEGKELTVQGQKVAVYRDEAGTCHALSPVCPHLGCHVAWNSAETSWDCPCHGGRFDARGKVLNGPPTTDLKSMEFLDAELESRVEKTDGI